jgi:hypothetical protein
MRTPVASLEPLSAWSRIEAQPASLRGLFLLTMLTLGAVMVDFTGRFGASLIFDLRRVTRVSVRRWALYRLAIQATLLLPTALCAWLAPNMFPQLHGLARFAPLAALLAPICLSAVEWWRACGESTVWLFPRRAFA